MEVIGVRPCVGYYSVILPLRALGFYYNSIAVSIYFHNCLSVLISNPYRNNSSIIQLLRRTKTRFKSALLNRQILCKNPESWSVQVLSLLIQLPSTMRLRDVANEIFCIVIFYDADKRNCASI